MQPSRLRLGRRRVKPAPECVVAPTLDYMDRAFGDAKQFGMSSKPIVELLIPSTVDDSLAPPGSHVASLFCQQFAPELSFGRDWDSERETAADLVIDTIDRYAPNFKASVIARQIHSPLDLERKFGLSGGDIHALSDVTRSAVVGAAHSCSRRLSGTLKGLYMCGAGPTREAGYRARPGITRRGKFWPAGVSCVVF